LKALGGELEDKLSEPHEERWQRGK